MREIKFKLTKIQKKHFKSIQWLLSEDISDRRSGRSFLLASLYIDHVLKNKLEIKIIDHAYITTGAGYRANKMLTTYIEEIIKINDLPIKIDHTVLTMKYE